MKKLLIILFLCPLFSFGQNSNGAAQVFDFSNVSDQYSRQMDQRQQQQHELEMQRRQYEYQAQLQREQAQARQREQNQRQLADQASYAKAEGEANKIKYYFQEMQKELDIADKHMKDSSYYVADLHLDYVIMYNKDALKIFPEANRDYMAIAYAYKGYIGLGSKDYYKAIEDFNTAIEISQKIKDAYYGRALAKRFLKDTYGSCADLSKAGELGMKEAYELIAKNCK